MRQGLFFGCLLFSLIICSSYGDRQADDDAGHLIKISALANSVPIGTDIELTGIIDPSFYDRSSDSLLLLVHPPGKSKADLFDTVPVASGGVFRYSVPADVSGHWEFEAKYLGKGSNTLYVDVIPPEKRKLTSISLSAHPLSPKVGDDVVFSGVLTDSGGKGVGERDVTYQIGQPRNGCFGLCGLDESSVNWRSFGSAVTDSGGKYSFNLPVVEPGLVGIRALFEGDAIYESSHSDVLSFTVS